MTLAMMELGDAVKPIVDHYQVASNWLLGILVTYSKPLEPILLNVPDSVRKEYEYTVWSGIKLIYSLAARTHLSYKGRTADDSSPKGILMAFPSKLDLNMPPGAILGFV